MTSAYPSANGINHRDIAIATATTADSIHWLKTYGLLNTKKICPSCGASMREVAKNNLSDGMIWSCGRPCRKMISIRKGTFLDNSKLKCEQIIDILYYWAKGDLAKNLGQECRIANVAVTDWRNYCRDVCAEYYIAQNIKLGGPNRIVEIDESAFVRRKYNVGHRVKTQWVFGALESDTRRCFLVTVEDRSSDTLLEIIQDRILPGTTIISDLWRSYNTLNTLGYRHLTVNHSINFVDPVTFATTNHIESLWKHAKNRNKRENGTTRNSPQTHLIEFM
ncbi:uncharacterized protein LOC106883699 [Octopus bimaculoides]|uniref:ISXO2-like transposase domain-containing protein n=1 Tax=Octopus bimaculoides TaxID=37653 RepID=A0A0L8FF94_OCTBM|nr:uncharacterized protein LOC106883699 [Octopus bimaculoides]|eukprot:XP_014790296.1 PREDICTED: uncharacterized protein LOC106883699 [Octopus bimaculoides]